MDLFSPQFLIDKVYSPFFITGQRPWWVFSATHNRATFKTDTGEYTLYGNIIDEFGRILKEYLIPDSIAAGYLSYDLKDLIDGKMRCNRIFLAQKDDEPLIYFSGYKKYSLIKKSSIYNKLVKKSTNYFNLLPPVLKLSYTMKYDTYFEKIQKIKEYIEDGEVYQINFSYQQRYSFSGDPFLLYLKLHMTAMPPSGAFLDCGKMKILSASPERFFRIKGGVIETFPIKGTVPAAQDRKQNRINRKSLSESIKDRAEHLMIVDLLRNDLGKICMRGSVKVDGLFSIKSYRTVHHMVSRIYGVLDRKITFADIIRAIFPGGSITGAPKIRAVQIIDELEDYKRGIYTGAIGYILPDGSADFNIAIRTLVINGNTAYYSVGGGIVYDSDPVKEYEETITKSRIIEKLIEELKNEENMLSERKVASRG